MHARQPPLLVDVVLAPALLPLAPAAPAHTVSIVVDVIRVTTSICVLFERGCQRVYAAESLEQARAAARALRRAQSEVPGRRIVLAGESRGIAPPGFDYGNSPAEFGAPDLANADVVVATTNGTRALHACVGSVATLAGSLRNATAVARAAVALSERLEKAERVERTMHPSDALVAAPDLPGGAASGAQGGEERPSEAAVPLAPQAGADAIAVICAGRGQRPAYDDTLCAGCLVERIERAAADRDRSVVRSEGARIALAAWADADRRGVRTALAESEAAEAIIPLGLANDLDWCASVDSCEVVPVVVQERASWGMLVVEPLAQVATR